MTHIVSGISCFFNRRTEIIVTFPLESKKMVFLLQSCITVQAVCHHKKYNIKKCEDEKKNKTEHNVYL